jgi:hypothetical protein
MWRTPALAALMVWSLLALVLGFWVMGRDTPTQITLDCRPSLPVQASAQDKRPVVLLLGNSLIFDHNWRLPGFSTVICARQGLTLDAALPLLPQQLDRMALLNPVQIIIGFGSVELIRAAHTNTAPDLARFETDAQTLVDDLNARWPNAALRWISVPGLSDETSPAHWPDPAHIVQMNTALRARLGPDLLDTDAAISLPPAEASYDGVHLSALAYGRLETALIPVNTNE